MYHVQSCICLTLHIIAQKKKISHRGGLFVLFRRFVGIKWCLLGISQWAVVLGEGSDKTKRAKVNVLLLAVAAQVRIARGELYLFTCEEQLWGGCRS